jgi:lambda family phage minor tail protein L
MLTLPTNVIKKKNKLATADPWLVFLDIELDASHKYYFVANNEDVTFLARTYTAFPFDIEAADISNKGEIPSVQLKVANVTKVIHRVIENLDGAVGAKVTIHVANTQYLELDMSELDLEYSVISTSASAEWLIFTLGAPNPLRRRFPPHRFGAESCRWEFKSIECGYSGGETTCNRTFDDCEDRANTRRFGGFRGLSSKGWRAV